MSRYYLPLNGSSSSSMDENRSKYDISSTPAHLPRTSTLLEVQTLMREHAVGATFGSKYPRKTDEDLAKIKKKATREYYEQLNQQLDYFLEVDELLSETEGRVAHTLANEGSPLLPISRASKDAQEARRRTSDNTAININLGINIALLALKILVVVLSDSLSLLASAVDSGMDFLSTLIIGVAARAAGKQDGYKYPGGGQQRLETIGVCIFAVLMVAAFFQIFIESVQRLWNFSSLSIVDLPLVAILSMVVTILVKAVVWLIYRSRTSTSVRALAQDAKVDVIFNAFSLFFPFIEQATSRVILDPLGAMVLSIYVCLSWIETLGACVSELIGKRADPGQHQRIVYLATRFSPLVRAVQYCNVYSAGGGGMIVEIDVLLPPDISLPKSHDICESIQYCIESLEGISRAYVHADYNAKNPSGHQPR